MGRELAALPPEMVEVIEVSVLDPGLRRVDPRRNARLPKAKALEGDARTDLSTRRLRESDRSHGPSRDQGVE
jgi:hypothetical protein